MTVNVMKDLRSAFPTVRDQGGRSSCLACATSDAHAAKATSHLPLSVEFAYFHASKILGGNPDDGLTFQAMEIALAKDGQPYESDWPYLGTQPDKASWTPPATIGTLFRANCPPQLTNIARVFSHLDKPEPVVIGIAIGARFMMPAQDSVFDRVAHEPIVGYHAVVGIGWGTLVAPPGARVLLARNSWGARWAMNGHAWLTEQYLEQNLIAYSVIH